MLNGFADGLEIRPGCEDEGHLGRARLVVIAMFREAQYIALLARPDSG
jgi:hypothetical protein